MQLEGIKFRNRRPCQAGWAYDVYREDEHLGEVHNVLLTEVRLTRPDKSVTRWSARRADGREVIGFHRNRGAAAYALVESFEQEAKTTKRKRSRAAVKAAQRAQLEADRARRIEA